jgi:hypothetical protein
VLNAAASTSALDMDIAVVVSVSVTVDILGLIAVSHQRIHLRMTGPRGSSHQ